MSTRDLLKIVFWVFWQEGYPPFRDSPETASQCSWGSQTCDLRPAILWTWHSQSQCSGRWRGQSPALPGCPPWSRSRSRTSWRTPSSVCRFFARLEKWRRPGRCQGQLGLRSKKCCNIMVYVDNYHWNPLISLQKNQIEQFLNQCWKIISIIQNFSHFVFS